LKKGSRPKDAGVTQNRILGRSRKLVGETQERTSMDKKGGEFEEGGNKKGRLVLGKAPGADAA